MANAGARAGMLEHFGNLTDPRRDQTKLHELLDIVVIAVCAMIGGAESFEDMELYGKAKRRWFRRFLKLPHGIPSHDTFRRVFLLLDPEAFQACFLNWTQAVYEVTGGQLLAIDGKAIRHSFDKAAEKGPLYMVSAWASQSQVVLAQRHVDAKSNEITAVPKLLDMLNVMGCIVTMDAMGCQKKAAEKIVDKGGNYVLALKGNQETIHEQVKAFFEKAKRENFEGVAHQFEETRNHAHGRDEVRRCWSVSDLGWLEERSLWKGLTSVVMIESQRTLEKKTTTEERYYISSLPGNAKQLNDSIRKHWGIENSLHWCLDVAMNEDQSRVRKGHAPANLAVLRHMAINMLKAEKTLKNGIKSKSKMTGWDHQYLLRVLVGSKSDA
jgi:predicted transposase YbfD/YdcC